MKKAILIFGLFFLCTQLSLPCTSIIVSGKYTANGLPLMWKHRDTDNLHNVIRYFNDGKYRYVGIVNANDLGGKKVWIGYNDQGFAIMNTVSYNIMDPDDKSQKKSQEGILMKMALMHCANLEDFENLLDTLSRPIGVKANFGCIDADGGAAYYETNNFTYRKLDVNDPKLAPFGYMIHTNYSFTGDPETGQGYIRYMATSDLFYKAAQKKAISARFILTQGSRNLVHGLTENDLRKAFTDEPECMMPFRDYVPRVSTASAAVIEGAPKSLGPEYMTMYTLLGWSLTTPVVPVYLAAEKELPAFMKPGADTRSMLSSFAYDLKMKVFPYQRGHMNYYININALLKRDGEGLLQKVERLEDPIWQRMGELQISLNGNAGDQNRFADFYTWLQLHLNNQYFSLN